MNPLRERIRSLEEQIGQFDQIRQYIDGLLVKRQKKQGVIERLQTWASQELKDVTKLEKNGKRNQRKNMRFDQEKAVEKEREEYLLAMRKVKTAERSLHILDFEIKVLREKLARLPDLQKQLKELYLQQEKEILTQGHDQLLQELSTKLEEVRLEKKRIGQLLERLQHCLVHLDEIKGHFERMQLLPNWKLIPQSTMKLAEKDLDRASQNILEIKQALNSIKEDWLSFTHSLPSNTLPGLKRINTQMNGLQRNVDGFRSKLTKPSQLNHFLYPAQQIIFKTRSDLEQAIQELKVEEKELESTESKWKKTQKERLSSYTKK